MTLGTVFVVLASVAILGYIIKEVLRSKGIKLSVASLPAGMKNFFYHEEEKAGKKVERLRPQFFVLMLTIVFLATFVAAVWLIIPAFMGNFVKTSNFWGFVLVVLVVPFAASFISKKVAVRTCGILLPLTFIAALILPWNFFGEKSAQAGEVRPPNVFDEARDVVKEGIRIGTKGQIQTGQLGWEIQKKPHTAYPATDPETGDAYVVATARCTVKKGQWSPALDLKKFNRYHFSGGKHCLPPGYKYAVSTEVADDQPEGAGGSMRVNQNPKWMVPIPTPSGTELPWVKDGVKAPDFLEFSADYMDTTYIVYLKIKPKGEVPTKVE